VNSGSWTNQGPQQWNQPSSVDNQSGQFPHSTMPQDQYTQMDQQGQLQHGTVLYAMIVWYDYSCYNRGYYMAEQRFGFYFGVVKTIFYEEVELQSL